MEITFRGEELFKLLYDKYYKNQINNVYYKFQSVEAIQYDETFILKSTVIQTITSDGLETTNKVLNSNDFIIKNQTQSKEQYIIPHNKFINKYELVSDNNSHNNNNSTSVQKWQLYKPKNNINNQIKVLEINQGILNYLKLESGVKNELDDNNSGGGGGGGYKYYLIASWGEKMIFKESDYLVIPNTTCCDNDESLKFTEIYRIARKEFNETYKLL